MNGAQESGATSLAFWQRYVAGLVRARGGQSDFGEPLCPAVTHQGDGGPVLLLPPHPDDESINGLLPLRLQRESASRIYCRPVTLGSRPDRRRQRLQELKRACSVVGFSLLPVAEQEFFRPPPNAAAHDAVIPQAMVVPILECCLEIDPWLVVFPHELDGHPTHQAVALLCDAVLRQLTSESDRTILALRTEYWHPMRNANLLVCGSEQDVVTLCRALASHEGEVARNPYHLRQPVRMMDTLFRAQEMLAGLGGRCRMPVGFFGELYRLERYAGGRRQVLPEKAVLDINTPASRSWFGRCWR